MSTIINSLADVVTWVSNANPGNTYPDPGAIPVAEALRNADGRPAWGEDWGPWLKANAERIALEVSP